MIVWLMLLSVGFVHSYMVDGELGPRTRISMTYKYERTDEVKKECASVLASASELKDDNRIYSIKQELSFVNGDWWQVSNGASLMPFDDREMLNRSSYVRSPLNLVSFCVADVDRAHRSKKSVKDAVMSKIASSSQTEDESSEPPPIDYSKIYLDEVGGVKTTGVYGLGSQASLYGHVGASSSSTPRLQNLDFDARVNESVGHRLEEMKEEMKQEMREEMNEEMKQEMREEMNEEMKQEMREALKEEMRQALCEEMRQDMQLEVQEQVDQILQARLSGLVAGLPKPPTRTSQ